MSAIYQPRDLASRSRLSSDAARDRQRFPRAAAAGVNAGVRARMSRGQPAVERAMSPRVAQLLVLDS